MTPERKRQAVAALRATWPADAVRWVAQLGEAEAQLVGEFVLQLGAAPITTKELDELPAPPPPARPFRLPAPPTLGKSRRVVPGEAVALLRRLGSSYTPDSYQTSLDEAGDVTLAGDHPDDQSDRKAVSS